MPGGTGLAPAAALGKSLRSTGGKGAPTFDPPPAAGDIDYPKLLAIFNTALAPHLAEQRCAAAIDRVARVNIAGLAIRDLPHIERLLTAAYAFIHRTGTRSLDAPLCGLMRCAWAQGQRAVLRAAAAGAARPDAPPALLA